MFIRIDNKWDLLQVRAAHQGKTRTKIGDDIKKLDTYGELYCENVGTKDELQIGSADEFDTEGAIDINKTRIRL